VTVAPKTLTDLGTYWTAQGGVNLGIVGNQKHCSGYHLGKDRIFSTCACKPDGTCEPGKGRNDYSVTRSRDKAVTNAAMAIDLGRLNGSLVELYTFSRWLVSQCKAGKCPDIREVIYSPDGRTVLRWESSDNLLHSGIGQGDSSHLTHTHISFYRDSEARDKRPYFAPFFALPDTSEENMDMNYGAERWLLDGATPVTSIGAPRQADGSSAPIRYVLFSGKAGAQPWTILPIERSRLESVSTDLSDDFWLALTGYALPTGDCADAIQAELEKASVRASAAVLAP
jgi:hypothetical protein